MKILINVVNARNVGGGLQVVYNFILGTQKYKYANIEWYYAVSECLDQKYLDSNFKESVQGRYFVFPNQPDFAHTYLHVQNALRDLENEINPDVIYTILGPCYNFFKHKEVIRFVHPWVVTSNPYAWSTLPLGAKIRMKLHIILLKGLLSKTKYIVTQTEAVKRGLIRDIHTESENIKVVNNVLPDIYSKINKNHINTNDGYVNICAVGAGYHKNLTLIPNVLSILEKKYGVTNYKFHITLPEGALGLKDIESQLKKLGYQDRVVNHGNLKQDKLAELYRICDVCFLPSVLEVFSASTIEAMAFGIPTVATKLPFNVEVFDDSCLYYSPMNAYEASKQLHEAVTNHKLREILISKMTDRLQLFNSFENYFKETVNFLIHVATLK